MHAAPNLEVEWVEDEAVVLHKETSHMFYLNTSAALLLALILEKGYPQAVQEMSAREGTVEEELQILVDQMVEQGLLIDE